METEESHSFQLRLNQWIASQGFWFQLRHSLSGGGNWSSTFFHLLGLALRVGLALLVLAAIGGIILVKRVDTSAFVSDVEVKMAKYFHAEKVDVSGFSRAGREGSIHRVGSIGTEASFFRSFDAKSLRFKMGLLDGLGREWDMGTVDANVLDLEIRSGLSSSEEVEKVVSEVFGRPENLVIQGLRVADARVTWGYYERAFGAIEGSQMSVIRNGENWRCTFKGGRFSQNWLRGFQIDELVVVLTREGLVVERGKLLAGDGSIIFQDVEVKGAEVPKPSGTLFLSHVPVSTLVPPNAAAVVDGTVSGELTLGGSTNSSEGITLDGEITLDGSDLLVVRDDFRVFEALSVVDYYRSYKRVEFDSGSFKVSTGGGELKVSNIDLKSGELMTADGSITVRRPTEAEIERLVGSSVGPSMSVGMNPIGGRSSQDGGDMVSLRSAGKASQSGDGASEKEVEDEDTQFYDELSHERRLRRDAMMRARDLYFFSGDIRLGLPADAFERSESLSKEFPADEAVSKLYLTVPMEGGLNELGLDLAEKLIDALR